MVIGSVQAYAGQVEKVEEAVDLSVLWVLPFVAILLCIAIIPLINSHFWEKNLWWISLGVFCVPMVIIFSVFMGSQLRHATIEKGLEYVSFIILLASLFIISGGILIKGKFVGTPVVNSIFLFIGGIIASIIGTTGASMLLIRPLIRANESRSRKAHIVIFFIFIVSNIGGVLTPLGDPPLFLGYLQGVPFTWTFRLAPQWAVTCAIVLVVFFLFDTYMHKKDPGAVPELEAGDDPPAGDACKSSGDLSGIKKDVDRIIFSFNLDRFRERGRMSLRLLEDSREVLISVSSRLGAMISNGDVRGGSVGSGIRIEGKLNLILLAGVVACIYFQGILASGYSWWPHFGPQEIGMLIMLGLSLVLTPYKSDLRKENGFTFNPIKEVALLFAGIFATMIPALYILEHKGAALGITKPWQFFWAAGSLSSFLDNAPTYLTFVSLAKGLKMVNDLGFNFNDGGGMSASVLAAISCGAVFMGANSYIGNGPNFMVRSIAEEQGVKMPSFFGYMIYSGLVLIPTFILITFIFFL